MGQIYSDAVGQYYIGADTYVAAMAFAKAELDDVERDDAGGEGKAQIGLGRHAALLQRRPCASTSVSGPRGG